MKCDLCNKKATVHLTEIVDDQMSEMHLCEDCAKDKSVQMEQQFGLADLLAGLTDLGKQQKPGKNVKSCPECGLTYEDFRKFGRLGCAQCYEAFSENLEGLLKKIHGSNKHLGKKVKGATAKSSSKSSKSKAKATEASEAKEGPSADTHGNDLENLKQQLKQAIEHEDFEQAAQLRDKIREYESGG